MKAPPFLIILGFIKHGSAFNIYGTTELSHKSITAMGEINSIRTLDNNLLALGIPATNSNEDEVQFLDTTNDLNVKFKIEF